MAIPKTRKAPPLRQGELLAMPNAYPEAACREGHAHGDPLAPPGYPNLGALRAEERERAMRSCGIPAEVLDGWYAAQVDALVTAMDRLRAALDHNLTNMSGPRDPRWRDWWAGEAMWRYRWETFERLSRAGHVLVCPNDGIEGVDTGDADMAALAARGAATGEGGLAWQRYCVTCAKTGPLRAAAAELYRAHKEANE